MQISVLGPVEVSVDGRSVALGGGKPRALLAMLALDAGSTVSSDRLIEGLWGEEPPATAAKMVQLYVSQLRKALAASGDGAEIVTRGRGYELRLGRRATSTRVRFERLLVAGRRGRARRSRCGAGAPLADVADEPFAAARDPPARGAAPDRGRAGDRRRPRGGPPSRGRRRARGAASPSTRCASACTRSGCSRCTAAGRQAEALEAYRQARARARRADRRRAGPGAAALHEAILRQDPALDPPAPTRRAAAASSTRGTPLVGREAELDVAARALAAGARAAPARLVLVAGARGIGKTRLAAELAGEVHRDGGAVLVRLRRRRPTAARAAIARARARGGRRCSCSTTSTAPATRCAPRCASWSRAGGAAGARAGHGARPTALARLRADATLVLGPLDADGVRADRRALRGRRRTRACRSSACWPASGGVPRRVHQRGERVGARARRRAALDARRRPHGGRARRAARGRGRARRRASSSSRRRASAPSRAAPAGRRRGLPVQGPRRRSTSTTPSSSSGASGSSPRWSRASPARRCSAIVGPSGSGKSSALRAGLLAALAGGVLPGQRALGARAAAPGRAPAARARAARPPRLRRDGRLVLAVDQFEEVFTACRDERERAAFVDALVALRRATRAGARSCSSPCAPTSTAAAPPTRSCRGCSAPTTCSSGRCAATSCAARSSCPRGAPACASSPSSSTRCSPTSRASPARCRCCRPRCSSCGSERDGRRLRLAAYERSRRRARRGRAAGRARLRAARRRRPAARRARDPAAARRRGRGRRRRAPPRRRSPSSSGRRRAPTSLDRARRRAACVTVGEGAVEVAHEALLREWPRLRGWLEEDAEGRRLHRHLARRRARLGRRRPRPRRALPRRAAGLRARLGGRPRAPSSTRPSARSSTTSRAARASRAPARACALRARRRRRAARRSRSIAGARRARPARQRARRGDAPPTRSGSAPRRSPTTTSTARCCSPARASRSTTRRRRAATCSPRCCAARRRSACCAATATRLIEPRPQPRRPHARVHRQRRHADASSTRARGDRRRRQSTAAGPGALRHRRACRLDQLRFSPDGSRLAVGGCAAGHPRRRAPIACSPHLQVGSDEFVYGLRFSPDGRTLFAVGGLPPAARTRPALRRAHRPAARPGARSPASGLATLMLTRDGRRARDGDASTATRPSSATPARCASLKRAAGRRRARRA